MLLSDLRNLLQYFGIFFIKKMDLKSMSHSIRINYFFVDCSSYSIKLLKRHYLRFIFYAFIEKLFNEKLPQFCRHAQTKGYLPIWKLLQLFFYKQYQIIDLTCRQDVLSSEACLTKHFWHTSNLRLRYLFIFCCNLVCGPLDHVFSAKHYIQLFYLCY